MFGVEAWKPLLTALLLPPVPLLVLMLIGARLILPRRGLGWFAVVLSGALLWLSACSGTAQLLSQFVLRPPVALAGDRIKELKSTKTPTAIMVLGGGLEPFAPEYGVSSLHYASLERLRYGVWLSRETGLPLGFSGGVGFAQRDAKPEAQIAAQIAASEFGRPLKFVEDDSRDTRENAMRTIALLRPLGIRHIVLVTHGWHMPRAMRASGWRQPAAASASKRRRWAWRATPRFRRCGGCRRARASPTRATSCANCWAASPGLETTAPRRLRRRPPRGPQATEVHAVGLFVAHGGPALA